MITVKAYKGIHCDGAEAFWQDEQGVYVQFQQPVGMVLGKTADSQDRIHGCLDVSHRCTPISLQQLGRLEGKKGAQHGFTAGRQQQVGAVLQDFDKNPPKTNQQGRAKLFILVNADNQFGDSVRDHFRDDEPVSIVF